MPDDPSNGYDAIADRYLRIRSDVGLDIVRKWMSSVPPGGSVVDVGAGPGEPLTAALVDQGFVVSAIDASANMVAALRRRFPGMETACALAEQSDFFNRTFDGVLAVGVVFLLPPGRQRLLIGRMADALKPGGRLLFSAPRQECAWTDQLTGLVSQSLGAPAYRRILAGCGLEPVYEPVDRGGNQYYDCLKRLL